MGSSLTRDEVRAFDAAATRELGLSGAVLMENAGRSAAEVGLEALGGAEGRRALVLCGGGNNGGDGYVVARHLAIAGVEVELLSCVERERLRGDAASNRRAVEGLGLPLVDVLESGVLKREAARWEGLDLLVDGLLGTGFQGALRAPYDAVLEAAGSARAGTRLALDLPSGFDCDSGKAVAGTFRADLTVTFVARKSGFDVPGAQAWTGRVVVAGIGVPADWRPSS